MGFVWKKTTNSRKVITESYDIRYKRISYLQQLRKYVEDKRKIIYVDECRQLIAGGRMGFVPDALLMLRPGSTFGDNPEDVNHTNFMQWIMHKLLPNLPPRSVLVIDNASYYNVEIDNDPMPATKKQDMIAWLKQRNIDHDPNQTKPELYQIIKRCKQKCNRYVLDVELQKQGHDVLHLPPFHPELNPMKRVWALVKNWVASQSMVTLKPTEMQELVDCVDKFTEEYLVKEHLLDLDEFVSVIDDSSDDMCSEEEEENY